MTTVILPEINFLSTDPNDLSNEIIKTYEQKEGRRLSQADPLRLIFLSLASVITKQNVAINDAARQNLLYYAREDVLKHKGAEWDTPILEETAAKTTLRMYLSTPLSTSRVISKGMLATSNEGAIFFASKEDVVINPGINHIDIELECTIKGEVGNNFAVGEINTLVKPLPYIDRIENITVTDGGTERESEESYRQRIYMAPEKLSNAGSTGAYEYFSKSASSLISDVFVDSPEPGHVNISVLLQNGELPSQEIIEAVSESVNNRKVRPLTDFVTVHAPEVIEYDLNMTYYIETNAVDKFLVQQSIENAVNSFIVWQSSKIGRDINPSKLISECIKAGAKRVEVISPTFTSISPGQVAKLNLKSVTFGGVEDD